jgi:site-specific recombinase XerD
VSSALDSYAVLSLDRADYGTHPLRRTKATLICRRTKNLRAVQLLLGHTKLESTVRYLRIEVNDALELAEQTEASTAGRSAAGTLTGQDQPLSPSNWVL